MVMQESGEMYLKTILQLSETLQIVRSIDIVHEMGFSKPSVSRAINNLKDAGYIDVDRDTGAISLLEPGKEIAEDINEKHKVISRYFIKLGVPEDIAKKDACRIEHIISEETFAALKKTEKKL